MQISTLSSWSVPSRGVVQFPRRPSTHSVYSKEQFSFWRAILPIMLALLVGLISILAMPVDLYAQAHNRSPINKRVDVHKAVVRIEVSGAFAPFGREANAGSGTGTGFFVDSSGLLVTNSHVIGAGSAATIEVFVDGERSPRTASVLGVSECADLAFLQVEGEDFPYLEWRAAPVRVGELVYAAGFPQGTFDYTMEKGIAEQADIAKHTRWGSLDEGIIRHGARIQPGNSGGPLVDEEGQVLGVNYLSNDRDENYFAISAATVHSMAEQLTDGQDVDSVGIDGEAFLTENGVAGIWVTSVVAGSPADRTRIRAGDILTKIQDLPVTDDGTLQFYCKVLRTQQSNPIKVTLYRRSTEQILEGRLPDEQVEPIDGMPTPTPTPSTEEYLYQQVRTDDLTAMLPSHWTDMKTEELLADGETVGNKYFISTDAEEVKGTWNVAGVSIYISSQVSSDVEKTLDAIDSFAEVCTYNQRGPHEHTVGSVRYTGAIDIWEQCGPSDAFMFVLGILDPQDDLVKLVLFQGFSQTDVKAFEKLRKTINFNIDDRPTPTPTPSLGVDDVSTYIKGMWDRDYHISEVAYGDGRWSIVTTRGSGMTRQGFRRDSEFPQSYIREKWDEGFFISDLSYGNGEWLVVTSKGYRYTNQSYHSGTYEEIKIKIQAAWDNDFHITELVNAGSKWFVVMTKGTGYTHQTLFRRNEFPEEMIAEKWDEDFVITSLAYGGNQWLAVMTKGTAFDNKGWRTNPQVPVDDIENEIRQQNYVTTLTYGDGRWAYVTSIQTEYTAQSVYFSHRQEQMPIATARPTKVPTPTPTPRPPDVSAEVQLRTLNVRSGPGIGYRILGSLQQGQRVTAVARNQNCSWVKIQRPTGGMGWIAASAQFAQISGNCMQLTTERVQPPPTAAASCLQIINHINDELTVTLTAQERTWNRDFKVARRGQHTECIEPGRYTYTISIPGGSINGEFTINRGETLRFPVH